MRWQGWLHAAIAATLIGSAGVTAWGHGFVGDRFFPATLATDDPLATDELAAPTLSLYPIPPGEGSPETRDIAAGFEFDKVIIPKLAVGVSDDYHWLKPKGEPASQGWDNVTLSLKYQLWENAPHEAVVSVGMETELGGTGSKAIGRSSFPTFTPTLYFGKGFGDLPDTAALFKPIALTGTLGLDLPTEAEDANALEWGVALEYSLPYLQQHVKDVGLGEPFKNMIPLVEFSGEWPLNRGGGEGGGGTTGTINPGVLWESRYFQVGVEAIIPMNHESGNHVGGMVQIQIYIDDLFPQVFGHPIFGG